MPATQLGHGHGHAASAIGVSPFIEEALTWLPDSLGNTMRGVELVAPIVGVTSDRRPFVLVVDDNADMRDYLRRLLGAHYELAIVGDGQSALGAIARRAPDLVLSDIMIPGLDGLQLVKRLRTDTQTKTVPIILLSARAGEESRVEGIKAGADDYMIKPFSASELLARIEALLNMSRYRAHATETLRASEERFRAFVTASSDVVYRMSPDWSEMRHLEGKDFIPDTDDPSESWLGKYIHPDDQAQVTASIKDAIRNKSVFELEHRVIRVDGSLGWTHSRALPVLDNDGEIVEWFGAARDITDRKRSEETQRLLLNELSHRVKNMLASVDAIAQHTLRRARNPAAFAESFSGRLQSMSRMHSLLTSKGWEGANLTDIIRDQVLPGATDDRRVRAAGPAVQLDPQTAMHTAMMLHELCTNSVKYGALSQPNGTVSIHWTVSDDSLNIDWKEMGGPPIKAPLGRGFGTTLIEQTVNSQGGSAHRSVEEDGMHWSIVLPLPSANEPAPKAQRKDSLLLQGFRASANFAAARLSGKKFAVIEDEPLIAINITSVLEQAGAQVVGPVATVNDALRLINNNTLDAALVDANLRGEPAAEIAAALTRKAIPFVFVTGYDCEALPSSFASAPILKKPFTEEQLLGAARLMVEQPKSVARLRN